MLTGSRLIRCSYLERGIDRCFLSRYGYNKVKSYIGRVICEKNIEV
jgi:hypothetical protein